MTLESNRAVTLIPKKGPNIISNFRLVSVVGVIPKIESVPTLSTIANLASFLSVAGPVVESRVQVDVVYLYFMKAFDKVPHHIFLNKLMSSGISPQLIQ